MSAKEMFEELGYEIPYWQKDHTIQYLKHYDFNDETMHISIVFYKRPKEVYIEGLITIKELEAINKQVEELGWLGDKE